jgi:hypothetical protein
MTTPTDANQEAIAKVLAELDPAAIPEIELTTQTAEPSPSVVITEPVGVFDNQEEVIDDAPPAAITKTPEPASKTVENSVAETKPSQETDKIIIPERKQQHVIITDKISIDGELESEDDKICLPSHFDEETLHTLQSLPNVDILSSAQGRQWTETVNQGLSNSTFNSTFVPTLEEEDAEFAQSVDFNGQPLDGRQVRFKQTEGQSLKGERAALRMMKHRGIGTIFQTPLWHTGIWLTLKAPSENELIELNRVITNDKIEMGRHTYGLAFSNIMSYTTDRLVDFAIDHLYDTSLKTSDIPEGGLKSLINSQDYPALLWGLVCTMYPKGFQFSRACTNNPEKCTHITNEILNLAKISWVNRAALTDWQKTHMSSRSSNSRDIASIRRYQEELKKIQKRVIKFDEGGDGEYSITLKTPTLTEFIDAGHRWIGDTVAYVDESLGRDASDKERNIFITRHSQATAMRQYIHWIDSIEFAGNIIDDRETIEETLNVLSSDNNARNGFMEEIVKYIHSSTINVIGIPVYDCPKCAATQTPDITLPAFKNIIPLDVNQLFFALVSRRLTKVMQR